MNKIYLLCIVSCLSVVLSACGNENTSNINGIASAKAIRAVNGIDGKNGVDGSNGIDGKESQTIRFIETNNKYAFIGDQFTRTINGGLGSGTVRYSSDNANIASVDATTGQVKVLSTGVTLIWAHKSSDGAYSAANDFYRLSAAPRSISFTAKVGSKNTLLNFSSEAAGLKLSRSSDAKCNLNNFNACQNSALNDINGVSIIDTVASHRKASTYWLKHGDVQSRAATISSSHFSSRSIHQAIKFNDGSGDRLWIIGGSNASYKNDVWSSYDGINWIQETAKAKFSARNNHQVVSFNDGRSDKLWLIGGNDGELKNDVWSSRDGVNWVEETKHAAFSARRYHQLVNFNDGSGDKLWLIGGNDGANKNDTWSSYDGVNWEQQTEHAEFSARIHHQVISFNDGSGDKLWLIAGYDGKLKNDIWSSSNGIDWIQQNTNAEFSPRYSHQVIGFNDGSGDKLWLVGGNDGEIKNDVWSSNDGINWSQNTPNAKFSARADHQVVSFNNGSGDKLWLIAGSEGTATNDVWSSSDGSNWTQVSSDPEFSARRFHQAVSFNDGNGEKLWLIGGDNGQKSNDVWSSSDGINWVQEISHAEFSARKNHQIIKFNNGNGNKLWLIGGNDGADKNDIWSSKDGVTWVQEKSNAAFSARSNHQLVNFNNGTGDKLWLIGGNDGIDKNDVWSSKDGTTWTQEIASAAFAAREHFQVVSFSLGGINKLWLIGGRNGVFKNDVWSSSDGRDWVQETDNADFSARRFHQVVNFDAGNGSKLWLIGGDDGTFKNDVWSSSNGINWQQESASTAFSARFSHQVVNFNDGSGEKLWLIGGDDIWLKNDVWSSSNGIDWRYSTHSVIRFD